jgi:hypothetical protein
VYSADPCWHFSSGNAVKPIRILEIGVIFRNFERTTSSAQCEAEDGVAETFAAGDVLAAQHGNRISQESG